jgi:hypothetical protein
MPTSSSSRPGRRPDPSVAARWQQLLQRFDQSGLSIPDFCAQDGLSVRSFYAWRRRLSGRPPTAPQPRPAPHFLPVQVLPAAAPASIELVLPGGTVLRLSPGCDLAFVRSVVESLGGASC